LKKLGWKPKVSLREDNEIWMYHGEISKSQETKNKHIEDVIENKRSNAKKQIL